MTGKGIKGRLPDRTIEFVAEDKRFSVFVIEVKTEKNAGKNEYFVKLASLMQDMLDDAVTNGISDYFVTGMLLEGPRCKIYRMNIPIKKLYCMDKISTFSLPDRHDPELAIKIEKLVMSMYQCRQLLDLGISLLHQSSSSAEYPPEDYLVDSYPSPPRHDDFYH